MISPRLTSAALLLVLLAAGLIFTVGASLYLKADEEAAARREFDFTCNKIRLSIDARLLACTTILRSGAALFDASETVTREQWRTFTRHLQIEEHLPGIQGVGYAESIPRAQLTQNVQGIRNEGFPDYQIRPAGEREIYSSIIYLEPFSNRNLRAFGYDMFSEPVRRAAMERARDENTAALSGRVTLVQESGQENQAGTLMYVPVYRHGLPIETREQRRAAIQGWVYSPYRMADLMRGTLRGWEIKQKERRIDLQVYDGSALSLDRLLFDSRSAEEKEGDRQSQSPLSKLRVSPARLTRLIPIDFAGNRWTLSFTQSGGGATPAGYSRAWIVLFGGAIITLLFLGLLLSLFRTRANSLRIAGQLTLELRESEERFSQLAEQSATIVWETDAQGLYNYVSPVSEAVWGYRPEEMMGRMHFYDLYPESGREEFKKEALAIFERQEPFRNLVNAAQTKDGRQVWVSTNGIPILNAEGILLGYKGSDTDVTAEKLIKSQISQLNLELEGRVLERTSELQSALGSLKAEFAGREVAEGATRDAERLSADICDSLMEHVAVLDAKGTIIAVNRAWQAFAEMNSAPGSVVISLGKNYLTVCEQSSGIFHAHEAVTARDGILAVLRGERSEFKMEYYCDALNGQGLVQPFKMFEMRVVPLHGAQKGVLVIHLDISERTRMEKEILEVSEVEQKRLGQDLHDDLGQQLTGLLMISTTLARSLQKAGIPQAAQAQEIARLFQHTIQTTRNLAKGFYPIELERGGLAMALLDLSQRITSQTGINCNFRHDDSSVFAEDKAVHLYRIVQEAINNAIKHGKPGNILIEWTSLAGMSTLRITDDGVGFHQPEIGKEGMGLHLFQYRGRIIGATIRVAKGDAGGCQVTCSWGTAPEVSHS